MTQTDTDAISIGKQWFAFRTFKDFKQFWEYAQEQGYETYVAVQDGRVLFPNLIFINCTSQWARSVRNDTFYKVFVYCLPGTYTPAVISERELNNFRLIVDSGAKLEPVSPEICFKKGDYVKITGGPFKGAEGFITRINNAKRMIVSIENVGAFSTQYVPKIWCQKMKENK